MLSGTFKHQLQQIDYLRFKLFFGFYQPVANFEDFYKNLLYFLRKALFSLITKLKHVL